jgi:hypothetical protein
MNQITIKSMIAMGLVFWLWLAFHEGVKHERARQTQKALATAEANLDRFVKETARLNTIADNLQEKVETLHANTQKTIIEYRTQMADKPSCTLDTDRLQYINRTIDSANAAATSEP